jgi:hypothetical protein
MADATFPKSHESTYARDDAAVGAGDLRADIIENEVSLSPFDVEAKA